MVITSAQLQQQTSLKEEEHLEQENDRAIMRELVAEEDSTEAFGGDQTEKQGAEGLEEDVQTEECSVETAGEVQTEELRAEGDGVLEDLAGVMTEVLTRKKLGKAQRYDKDLVNIKVKAKRAGEPYFWRGGLLM